MRESPRGRRVPAIPAVECLPLAVVEPADLGAVTRAMRDATDIPLGQAWRDDEEPEFAPAVVRTGWRGQTLFVLAELVDHDITTQASAHNQRFWELGDTFELFLQPAEGEAYVEFHVTPTNLRLALRFEGSAGRHEVARDPLASRVSPDIFRSRTWCDDRAGRWHVLAEIPGEVVCGRQTPLAGTSWRFSFSRYDYTRGRVAPVISSTSPHAEPNFHRRQEWGTLAFAP